MRVETKEFDVQHQPTIYKYLAHLTVLYAKILERKMGLILGKRFFSNDDFAEVSRAIHELGYLIDLHDKVGKTQTKLLKP